MITKKNISIFEKKIGYFFKNKSLLINALTHPSFISENKKKLLPDNEDFERLEFLGDRVLGLSVASLIYKKFNKKNEGDLSKKLSYLVQKNFLFKIANELSIDEILMFSFKSKNIKMNMSVLADAMESIIGAIYLDGGFSNAVRFVKNIWGPYLDVKESNMQDPKTQLQEISQQKFKKLPVYVLLNKDGPPHYPNFTISLKALNLKKIKASGSSIREAEKNAASIAIKFFNEKQKNT